MPNEIVNVAWRSLSVGLKILVAAFITQSTITCLAMVYAAQWVEVSSGIIILGPIEDPEQKPISTVKEAVNEIDLSCFPRDLQMKSVHSRIPTSFLCGTLRFDVETYDESYSKNFLGGEFPEGKTLVELGCRADAGRIACSEETIVDKGRASGVRAYRSFTASITNPADYDQKSSKTFE